MRPNASSCRVCCHKISIAIVNGSGSAHTSTMDPMTESSFSLVRTLCEALRLCDCDPAMQFCESSVMQRMNTMHQRTLYRCGPEARRARHEEHDEHEEWIPAVDHQRLLQVPMTYSHLNHKQKEMLSTACIEFINRIVSTCACKIGSTRRTQQVLSLDCFSQAGQRTICAR